MADWKQENNEVFVTKRIFKNQPLSLDSLPTGADLTNATAVVIKYRKPNGDTGTFTNAASVDSPATSGLVTCTIDANELDQAEGERRPWKIWAYVTDANGNYPGTRIILPVFEEGDAPAYT